MEIQDEISKIEQLMDNVRQNEPPYELPSLPPHDKDPGLTAGLRLQPLKMKYFVPCAVHGHVTKAKQVLKQINKPLHDSLFTADMTEEEVLKSVLELAQDYQKEDYQKESVVGNKELNSAMLSKQILSLISFVDLEDKKRLLLPDATNQDDQKKLLQRLKRVKGKLKKLDKVQTLIGANFVDFRRLA
ncbi:hypothetical protein U9M48_034583 [Paspalum notatum var. saurae]|uniref:Uncharacterized protein n=1 Tax=Paspalum notatum var. saurae TaxID=547442 RepID=A0AAQ3UAA2_PASNO